MAGHWGRTSARWRGAAAVAAAGAVLLAVSAAAAVPASAAGGYTVTATIPVGSYPIGVAVDPATRTAYVTNGQVSDNTVSVIDEATSTVTATIGVGGEPWEVAVDPSTHTAYVANSADDTVSVISSAARPTPVTTVTSPRNPSAFGQKVTFTATVGPAGPGTVTFSRGSRALCRAVPLTKVRGRTYRAACTTRALPPGRDTITARYHGDARYGTSAGTLTQTVTPTRPR